MLNRRGILAGIGSLLAAPVKARFAPPVFDANKIVFVTETSATPIEVELAELLTAGASVIASNSAEKLGAMPSVGTSQHPHADGPKPGDLDYVNLSIPAANDAKARRKNLQK